jgi:hypothetical protein
VAETNALLKRRTGNRTEGSNPSVSATAQRANFSDAEITTRERGQRRNAASDDAALPWRALSAI